MGWTTELGSILKAPVYKLTLLITRGSIDCCRGEKIIYLYASESLAEVCILKHRLSRGKTGRTLLTSIPRVHGGDPGENDDSLRCLKPLT